MDSRILFQQNEVGFNLRTKPTQKQPLDGTVLSIYTINYINYKQDALQVVFVAILCFKNTSLDTQFDLKHLVCMVHESSKPPFWH